uniref:Uncharacterized protein n=1 Tax=Anguilla anguilla TaxID=7936 RepID=A0A0E9W4P7_ANGAN
MDSLMLLKLGQIVKALAADAAAVRLVSRVNSLMSR